jgi:4a-hydroxytetrahydrobiopterin dehydratase
MKGLIQMQCIPCRGGEPTVSEEERQQLSEQVPEWNIIQVEGVDRLQRVFKFKDFARALAFTNRVGELAEQNGHHPAILTEWGRVTVTWWTHAIHGLHRNDFIMAAKTDGLYSE